MATLQPPKLIIARRERYLYVEYAGNPVTLEMLVGTINTVGATLRESGIKRVLIVRNAPLLHDDANRGLVASLVKRIAPPGVRYAIVDVFGNDPQAVLHAAEASQKAGWDLRPFDTVEGAAAWLNSSEN